MNQKKELLRSLWVGSRPRPHALISETILYCKAFGLV